MQITEATARRRGGAPSQGIKEEHQVEAQEPRWTSADSSTKSSTKGKADMEDKADAEKWEHR